MKTLTIESEATANKANGVRDARIRRLLFFIQSLAAEWGMTRLVETFLDSFPERLGIPYVSWSDELLERAEGGLGAAGRAKDELRHEARELAKRVLPARLVAICTDPGVELSVTCERDCEWRTGVPYFRDLIGGLFEFQDTHASKALAAVVPTEAARTSLKALDQCLETRSFVLVEGPAGAGKSQAVQAWLDAHRGDARVINLVAACNKSEFFRHLARELGVRTERHFKDRVEIHIWSCRVALVIDEAHHLWGRGGGERMTALIDWLDTACYNHRIPVALFATSEFTKRKAEAERKTGWASEQFARRVRYCYQLPSEPTEEDLRAVASSRLRSPELVKLAVGYALCSRRFYTGIVDLVSDAELLARAGGRAEPGAKDFRDALDRRLESDRHLLRAVEPSRSLGRARRVDAEPLKTVQRDFNGGVNVGLSPDRGGRPVEVKRAFTVDANNLAVA
jgi:hypothetical protein